jgi:isopenicillin N synthase-like dioxygenase
MALDLPENYFDCLVTFPGSDGAINYYPASLSSHNPAADEVGLGSHTDLQCFTLLWQDQVGGLQVLNKSGEWINANPIPETLVVNIGDFLMRLSNDRFVSTVHRVYNRAVVDRLSMPFFFGFNFNEAVGVLPTCVDEDHPAKYEPISCGEVSAAKVLILVGSHVSNPSSGVKSVWQWRSLGRRKLEQPALSFDDGLLSSNTS